MANGLGQATYQICPWRRHPGRGDKFETAAQLKGRGCQNLSATKKVNCRQTPDVFLIRIKRNKATIVISHQYHFKNNFKLLVPWYGTDTEHKTSKICLQLHLKTTRNRCFFSQFWIEELIVDCFSFPVLLLSNGR